MKALLGSSLIQMKKIENLKTAVRQLAIKHNRAFTSEPEDIIRILALIQELNVNQLNLSNQIGSFIKEN